MENLSISILGLSEEPLKKHTEDFLGLTKMTSEGCYMNLTKNSRLNVNDDTTKFDKLMQQF